MQFDTDLPANFFENVELFTLSHRGGKYNVDTKSLYIISHTFDYRGSKAAFGEDEPPFYLRHEESFEGACQLFSQLFDHEPDLFAWFENKEKTWNAFLVTSRRLYLSGDDDQTAYLAQENRFRSYFNYFPVIGSINSYGQGENPGFYYLVATPFRQGTGSFLTLANFRFQRESDKLPFITFDPYKRQKALSQTITQVSQAFDKAEREFNALLDQMANGYIARELFMPVVLDLYDKNRNAESVANDSRLQRFIHYLAQSTNDFLPIHQAVLPWTDLIQFIIRNNEVDLDRGLRVDEVEELFSRKWAYAKFIELFKKFLKDTAAYERYIKKQFDDWQAIRNLI